MISRASASLYGVVAMRLRRPRSLVVAVGSDAERKPRNTAEAPEMAGVLARVPTARDSGTGAPRTGIMWGLADRIWERLSIS
jgi:hypothetical protein